MHMNLHKARTEDCISTSEDESSCPCPLSLATIRTKSGVNSPINPLPTISFSAISATIFSVSASAAWAMPSSASMSSSSSSLLLVLFSSPEFLLLFALSASSCLARVLAALAFLTDALRASVYTKSFSEMWLMTKKNLDNRKEWQDVTVFPNPNPNVDPSRFFMMTLAIFSGAGQMQKMALIASSAAPNHCLVSFSLVLSPSSALASSLHQSP
mmetsp:Transcript_21125/g.32101  ORF Transcript_21125/g.32101 Transcript_21125/m.32101 type:complete len:213 (+) Transcript_21125:936-1574(+)